MRRLLFLPVALALLAACSDCTAAPCTPGITFYVSDLAGSLAPGSEETITLCLDGECHDVTVSRQQAGGTVFVAFDGVGEKGDHQLTVAGPPSVNGEYTGPLEVFDQDPSSCGTCSLGAVKIGADGTLTPGAAAPTSTTQVPSTTGG